MTPNGAGAFAGAVTGIIVGNAVAAGTSVGPVIAMCVSGGGPLVLFIATALAADAVQWDPGPVVQLARRMTGRTP